MQKDDSPVDHENKPATSSRAHVKYSRAELLYLSKSPLVTVPDGMPELTEWFGQPDQASPVMNKREPKELATAESGPGRERRYRREDEEGGSRYRPSLSQGGPMGSFRLAPVRAEGDRLRTLDSFDKDRGAGLASSSLALRRDRERDRDTAPHLSKREPGAAPLRGGERVRETRDRDPGRETAADRAADRERAREAGRRRKEEELTNDIPKRERGRAGDSHDWRSKDAEGGTREERDPPERERDRERDRDRNRDRDRDRERERERDAEYMRKYGDSWVPEPDRYDRDRRPRERDRDRDRDRDREWESTRDRERERERSRERSEFPPRSNTGRTPWDTEKERAAYDRRRREERDGLRRGDNDRDREGERDKGRRVPSPDQPRRRRSRSRQRSPSPLGVPERRRRPGMRDDLDEREPAWATDDAAPVGGLRGILGSGEDKLQAWKRQMKEAEEKKKEVAKPSEVVDDRDSGEDAKDASVPPGLGATEKKETTAAPPAQSADPPLPLHLRLAGKSSHAFKGIGQATTSAAQPAAPQSVADKLAEIVSAPNYGQNQLMTPQTSQDTMSPPQPSEGAQISVAEFFGVGQNGLADAAKKAAELNRPISTTASVPPPHTLLPSPTPTLPPTTGPIMAAANASADPAPRGSRFAKLWDNRPNATAVSQDIPAQMRMEETASLGSMMQGLSLGGPPPSNILGGPPPSVNAQNNDQQRMNELLSTLRGVPSNTIPAQTRTSPMNTFSSGGNQVGFGQPPIAAQASYAGQYLAQREVGYAAERLPALSQPSQPTSQPQNQYQQLYEYKQQQRAQQMRELEAAREREIALQQAQAQREQRERMQLAAQRELQIQEMQQEMRLRQYQNSVDYEREQQRERERQYYEYQQRLMQQQSQQQVQLQQRQHLQQQQQQQQQQPSQQQALLAQFQQPQAAFSPSHMEGNPYERVASRSGDIQRDRSLTRQTGYEHLPNPPASLPQRPPGMTGPPFGASAAGKPLTPGSMFPDQGLPPQQTGLPMRPQQGLVSPQSQYPPSLPLQQGGSPYNTYPNAGVLGHSRSGTAASMSGFPSPSGPATTPGGITYHQQQQLQAQQQRQTQQQLLLSQFQSGLRGGLGGPGAPMTSPPIQQQHGQPIIGANAGGQQLPPHLLSGRLPPQF